MNQQNLNDYPCDDPESNQWIGAVSYSSIEVKAAIE